jgi:hypothetical protein
MALGSNDQSGRSASFTAQKLCHAPGRRCEIASLLAWQDLLERSCADLHCERSFAAESERWGLHRPYKSSLQSAHCKEFLTLTQLLTTPQLWPNLLRQFVSTARRLPAHEQRRSFSPEANILAQRSPRNPIRLRRTTSHVVVSISTLRRRLSRQQLPRASTHRTTHR